MKLESNWKEKTIENLEKDVLHDSNETTLVKRCNDLRKISLNKFSIEDIRMMISQEIGLQWLIPLAIEILNKDLFAEGDLYKGDLLKSVLSIHPDFWNRNLSLQKDLATLINTRRKDIIAIIPKISFDKFDYIN